MLSPAEGDAFAVFPLTITCGTPGAEIHYTLSGSEPTLFDPAIASGGTLTINRNWTVKAKAWLAAETSATTTGDFMLTGDISAGGAHSQALKSTGGLWAWGLQTYGRLGNNVTSGNATSPVASRYSSTVVIGDAAMVAAGTTHSVFLKNGGTVWSYGLNTTGALGNNSTTTSALAVQVKKSTGATDYLTGSVAVAAGDGFSAALSSTGEVYTWGNKVSGRLGDGTTTGTRLYADKVFQGTSGSSPLTGIGRIAAAGGTALAIEPATGNVWAWGNNASGQLGQGNITNLSRALRVKLDSATDLTDVLDIACAADHSAVVRWKTGDPALQGRVFCFGQQQDGRLGNNLTTAVTVMYPVQVVKTDASPLEGIVSVAAGSAHTLALDGNGNVWAWGYNLYGALGDNTTTSRGTAAKVQNPAGTGDLSNIVRIAAGGSALLGHSMAVAADGTVYTWGYNANGQLGNGTTSTAATKLPVTVGGSLDLLPTLPDINLACDVSIADFPGAATLTATPTGASSSISKVEFYVNGGMVGQLTAAPWLFNLSNLTEGDYHAYAVATDSGNLLDFSTSADFTIGYDPNAVNVDSDGDGLGDSAELALGTLATDADTDNDGIPDGIDTAPLIPDTVPLAAASTLMIWSPFE